VPDWRDTPPAPLTPRWSELGRTRRRCPSAWAGEPGSPRLLPPAHAARVSAAPQAVGGGRVALETCSRWILQRGSSRSVSPALHAIHSIVGHASDPWLSLATSSSPLLFRSMSKHWREDPGLLPKKLPHGSSRRVPPPLPVDSKRRRNASQCSLLPRAADEPMGALGSSHGHGYERSECACC